MTTNELQAFMDDHKGHELDFDNQEFILCHDCDETFLLPEGAGVNWDTVLQVAYIEVPSEDSFDTYKVDVETGLVTL